MKQLINGITNEEAIAQAFEIVKTKKPDLKKLFLTKKNGWTRLLELTPKEYLIAGVVLKYVYNNDIEKFNSDARGK